MPLYTEPAEAGAFLALLKSGMSSCKAAAAVRLTKSTVYDIKERAANVEIEHAEQGLPLPTFTQQVAIRPKTGQPPVLTEAQKA
jgi:hypothetical protein